MAGFLDQFDSFNVLGSLLGIGGGGDQSGAAAAGGPPPAPPMAEPPKDQGRVVSAPYPPPMAYSNEDPVDFPGRFQGVVAGQEPQPGPGGAPMPPPRPPGSPGAVDALADGGGMGGSRPALGAQRLPMPPMAAGGGQPGMGGAQEAGGLMQALGLHTPQGRRSAFAALASGLQNVGKGHGGMAAFAGGAGAALGGGQKNHEEDFDKSLKLLDYAVKARAEGNMEQYRAGMLAYHNAVAEQGKFQFLPGSQNIDGKDVPGMFKVNSKDGSHEFVPGSTVTARTAAGGRGGVTGWNAHREQALIDLYGKESPEYAAFIRGEKSPNRIETSQKALLHYRSLLRENPELKQQFQKGEDADSWVKRKAKEHVDQVFPERGSSPLPGARPLGKGGIGSDAVASRAGGPVPAWTAKDQARGAPDMIDMNGNGTQSSPYKPQSADDYDQLTPGSYYVHPDDGKMRLRE